jgi:hypothetical protein
LTRQNQGGLRPVAAQQGGLAIYQTASYEFRDTKNADGLFALTAPGFLHLQVNNLIVDVLERRVAETDGKAGKVSGRDYPWAAFEETIIPFYTKSGKRGRPPKGTDLMPRMYFPRARFNPYPRPFSLRVFHTGECFLFTFSVYHNTNI